MKIENLPYPVLAELHLLLDPNSDPRGRPGQTLHGPVAAFPPSLDLISLASCSKALRSHLMGVVFKRITVGHWEEDRHDRLEWLSEHGGAVLGLVKVVEFDAFKERTMPVLVKCIKRMKRLESIVHFAPQPFSPLIVDALQSLLNLHALYFNQAGLRIIVTEAYPLPLTTSVDGNQELWPYTFAVDRRVALSPSDTSISKQREQADALAEGLANILDIARGRMEVFAVDGKALYLQHPTHPDPYSANWLNLTFKRLKERNVDAYPSFPDLKGFRMSHGKSNCSGLEHLLETSPRLKELDIGEIEKVLPPAPDVPVEMVEHLCLLVDDFIDVSNFVGQTCGEYLRSLLLHGIRQKDLSTVFGRRFPHLQDLKAVCFGTDPVQAFHLRIIVKNCPALVSFDFNGQFWNCEATDIFNAIRPLRFLQYFAFDHPWEKPRSFPFPSPDGQTIRTARHGNFRIISTRGNTIHQEMRRRIREDVKAVTSKYHKRFAAIGKAHPSLLNIV